MNTDLIVRFIQNIRVHLCPSVVYKYTNLACSTLGHKDFKNHSGGHLGGATATLMAKLMDDSCEACCEHHYNEAFEGIWNGAILIALTVR
jgi:hypothetical protein